MSDVIESHFACRCLNVQVTAHVRQGQLEVDTGSSLRRDVKICLSETRKPVVQLAQAPLTCRVTPYTMQNRSEGKGANVTALTCINCDTTVYAVDKIYQPKNGRNARSTGFNIGSSSNATGTRLSTPSGIEVASIEQDSKLMPDPEGGAMWLLEGCVYGSEAIRALSSSDDFSKSFKLLVRLPNELARDANLQTDVSPARKLSDQAPLRRKEPSPSRRSLPFLPASSQRRSAASPSPNRRRNIASAEHEEERGDDLDTLHLLETLLPHVPTSLTSQSKPYVNGDQGLGARRNTLQRDSPISQSYRSPDKGGSSKRHFDSKLDEQATATLRNRVREVQQELYQLLKLRSEEIAQEQERLRREAQYLAQKVVRSVTTAARRDAATSVGSPHPLDNDKNEEKGQRVSLYDNDNADDAESTSPTVFVRRRPYVPAMEKTASQDSNASRRVGSGSSAIGVPGREALGQSIAGNVGSYLSASFAMRGRDLPGKPDEEVQRSKEDEEDWFAQKKRLRERYPHADHSALPSAVNSDDEESVAVKARDQIDSSDSEQDQRRGRGRGRQSQQSGHSHVQKTPTPPRTREKEADNGRGKDPKQGLRSMLGSDTSGSFGDDGGSQGGKTMRGALKRTGNVADEQRPTAATEKKVAFASTNVEHDIAPSGRAGERSPSPHEPIAPGDAVFEIDEDLEDDDDVSPSSSEITIDNRAQALEGGADQMIQEALRDEMGEADVEDEESETAEGYAAQEANLKYSLPIAGSFSVLAETESRRASLAAGLTEENTLNFDPASLRFDGRTVYASGTGDSLPVIYSSARRSTGDSPSLEKSALGASAQPLSAPSSRMATKTIRSADMLTGDRLQGSAIGFRVAVGEAEARLSGVLAPHAPSHRGLYAADDRRKRSTEKYALKSLEEDEEDEEGSAEDDTEEHALTKDEASFKHSKGRAISSRGTDAVTTGALLASSVPASAQMMIRRASSAVQRDPTSGFVLEPKTSLPYQEKMLTPSLLKAMRAQAASSQHRSSLAAISDSSDNTAASGNAQQAVDEIKRATHAQAVDMIKYKNVSDKQPDFQYSVPASVTRGFEAAGLGINQVDSFKASTQIPSNGIAPVAPVPHTAVLATMSPFSRSVQSSPMLGSSAGTGRSSRQRSPRPPYIQPPPPSTTDMRLTPDAEHRPQSIALAINSVLEDGYDEQELLRFMHTVENLKTFKRTGWYHHRIERPESIADHMYRMALLSMLLPDDLDIGRCVQLCIVHDLAEALVGDLTPLDGVSKEEKLRREHDAIQHLVYDQLDGSEMGLRIESIWNEYEDRQTRESKVVKDLDRFELALQAVEYERRNQTADLQPFYSSAKDIEHSRVQGWMLALAKERERLWKQTDYSYQQHYPTTTAKSAAAEDEGDKTVVS